MKIRKDLQAKILSPRENEEWFCKVNPDKSRCQEPAFSFSSVSEMRANYSNRIMYWFHPDTAFTSEDIESETLFASRKRKFGEKNSVIYCVASTRGHVFGVSYNSRTAFIKALKDVDWVYPYAAMPVALFLDEKAIPRTIALDDDTAFYNDGKMFAENFVPLPIDNMVMWLFKNPNLSPTVLTSANAVNHDDFWGMMPWELNEEYGNIYVITEEDSNISGASTDKWNHRSIVGAVNEIKESIITEVTGEIYLLGTGSHKSILKSISHITSIDKIAVVDELNGNVLCTVPRSICDDGVEHLSIKRLYDTLPPKTLLPARFTVADMNASQYPEPYMNDIWTICIEGSDGIRAITCLEDNLIAYTSLLDRSSSFSLIGVFAEGNKKYTSCINTLYDRQLSCEKIFDICALAALDTVGILPLSHAASVLFYMFATNPKIRLDNCVLDATITNTGYLESAWVNSHINRTGRSIALDSDEDVCLLLAVRHILAAIDRTEGPLGEDIAQRMRYARLMLVNKAVPSSLFEVDSALY